jgi:hypothetical protein
MASQQKTDNRAKIENPGKKPDARRMEGRKLDDALDDSFPASDPPSQTDPTKGMSVDKKAIGKMHKNAETKH